MKCVAKCGCYFCDVDVGKMINCPLKQTSAAQVDYLHQAGVSQAVVSVRGLEQNLNCIFLPNFFLFPLVMYSFLSMWQPLKLCPRSHAQCRELTAGNIGKPDTGPAIQGT